MKLRNGEIATTLTVLTLGLMLLGTLIGSRTAVLTRLNSLTPRAQTTCSFKTRATVYLENRDESSIVTFDETFGDSWKIVNDRQPDGVKFKTKSGDTADLKLSYNTITPYNPGDLASVRLRGPNDDDWDISGVFCDNKSTTTNGCPADIANQATSPQRMIQNFKIDCGVDIEYGWVLHSIKQGGSSVTPPVGGGETITPTTATTTPAETTPTPIKCTCKSNPGGERFCSPGCQSRRVDGWCTTDNNCVPEEDITITPTPKKTTTSTPPKKPTVTVTPPKTTPTITPVGSKGPKGDPTLCAKLSATNPLTKKQMAFDGPIHITFLPSGFSQSQDAEFRTWITRLLTELDSTNLGARKSRFSFDFHKLYSRQNFKTADIQQSLNDCGSAIGIVLYNNDSLDADNSNFVLPQQDGIGRPVIMLSTRTLQRGPHIFARAFGTLLGLWYEFIPEDKSIWIGDSEIPYVTAVKKALDNNSLGAPDKIGNSINCFSETEIARSSNQQDYQQNCTLPELFALKGRNVMSAKGTPFTDSCLRFPGDPFAAIRDLPACVKSGGMNFTSIQLKYVDRTIAYYQSKLPAPKKAPQPKSFKATFNEFDLNQDGSVNALDIVRCLRGGLDCSIPSILFNLGSSR